MKLEYYEKPNYNKLQFLLVKELLNDNIVPNKIFNFQKLEGVNFIKRKDINYMI
jgi:hypothetical protein